MRDSWLQLIEAVLRPARPQLARCLRERERHLDARRAAGEQRTRALADCRARIEAARAVVFAANDGVISRRMTDLEREWRRLARQDPDAGLMDLWARIAPSSWLDQKLWRGSEPATQVDAAVALAADVEGVEEAASAVRALRVALAPWGMALATGIHWRARARTSAIDADCTTPLLSEPLRAALAALFTSEVQGAVLARARRLEHDIHEAAGARFPDRPLLVRSLAHAAFVDSVWHGAALADHPNPVTSLRRLWKTGYALASIDASGVTLEIPPLPARM
jgi:hypothetical protein